MSISVVIPTYREENYPNFCEAVASLRIQSLQPEIIAVVGGDQELYDLILEIPEIDAVLFDKDNLGATHARNLGAAAASGDVVAFLDDDEVAAPNWCAELVRMYTNPACGGAGGRNLPLWECESNLPEELWWLVGVTHKGFAPKGGCCVVRNTFAGNMSFRRNVFTQIGGFKSELGLSNGNLVQGEEPEICDRMREVTGKEFWYNPTALIHNRVPARKVRLGYLFRRAYWQGITKAMLENDGHSLATEHDYLHTVMVGMKHRMARPSAGNLHQMVLLVMVTGITGLGYMVRKCRS